MGVLLVFCFVGAGWGGFLFCLPLLGQSDLIATGMAATAATTAAAGVFIGGAAGLLVLLSCQSAVSIAVGYFCFPPFSIFSCRHPF